MMNRRSVALSLVALPFVVAACSSMKSAANPMIGALTSSLGVTEDQAMGGVGAMLTLAQEKLTSGQFDQVAKYVPGASKYIDMAKSLGAVSGPLGGMSGLTSAMGKLGISPATAAKFVPAVTDYVGKVGGADVGNMLAGVFK
jgi:hypothetical protein